MVKGPDFVGLQTDLISGPGATAGRGLALLAPHTPTGDQVSANVLKSVRLQRVADELFGAGSTLAEGFRAAKGSGLRQVYLIGVDALTDDVTDPDNPETGPFTETLGDGSVVSSGNLNANRLPITSVTSVNVDGAAHTVILTREDPTTLTLGATETAINLDTGAFALGTDTAGDAAGAVFVYESHDWDAAFSELDLQAYEYAVPAGVTLSEANWGVIQKFIDHAEDENKMLAFGLPSGTDPADVQDMLEAMAATQDAKNDGDGDGRIFPLFAHYTGDLSAAIAGQLASRPSRSTRKMQAAPAGVTYTGTYTFSEFGGSIGVDGGPVAGTIHHMGANAVYESDTGRFEVSSDRSLTTIASNSKWHSNARMVREVEERINGRLLELRRSSDTGITMSTAGIQAITSVLEQVTGELLTDEIIDRRIIDSPTIDEISSADRSNRILDLFDVRVRLTGQVHFVAIGLNVEL